MRVVMFRHICLVEILGRDNDSTEIHCPVVQVLSACCSTQIALPSVYYALSARLYYNADFPREESEPISHHPSLPLSLFQIVAVNGEVRRGARLRRHDAHRRPLRRHDPRR